MMSTRPENFDGSSVEEIVATDCGFGAIVQNGAKSHIGRIEAKRTTVAYLNLNTPNNSNFIKELREYFLNANELQIQGLIKDLEGKEEITEEVVGVSILSRGLTYAKETSQALIVEAIVAYFKSQLG